jgi:hypothetical protein
MSFELAPHLEWLEARLDPAQAEAAEARQQAAAAYESASGGLPVVVSAIDDMSKQGELWPGWPVVPYGEAFRDPAAMLLSELRSAHEQVMVGDDRVITLRANYGVGVIPSLLGCEVVQQGDELPWVQPLSREALGRALAAGPPNVQAGLAGWAEETAAYFRETLAPYPALGGSVRIGIADNQGPFNLAAEVIGTDIYTLVLENSRLVQDVLELVTDTYIAFTQAHKAAVGEPGDVAYNFQCRLAGGARICEDNALSISPRLYEQLCAPCNAKALAAFGGGTVLVCGEPGPHFEIMAATRGVRGFLYWHERPEAFGPAYEIARRRKQAVIWYGALPEGLTVSTGVIVKRQARTVAEGKALLLAARTHQ